MPPNMSVTIHADIHVVETLPIGHPSSQDAGLIATRKLSLGEPIRIVERLSRL